MCLMLLDLLAPPQGTKGGGAKTKCAVARPINVSNSHTKFGWISSNFLGGDRVTDGRRRLQYPQRFFLKKSVGIITYHDDGTAFLAILVALAVVNVVRNEY